MSEKLEAVATSEAPAALGAYSQAVKANGFVFVSGQLGIDPATGELAGESAGEQAAQALKNIKHILDTAGSGIENVVRATIYMKNVEDFHEVDDVYAQGLHRLRQAGPRGLWRQRHSEGRARRDRRHRRALSISRIPRVARSTVRMPSWLRAVAVSDISWAEADLTMLAHCREPTV